MLHSGDQTVDTPTFVDGIGRRVRVVDSTGEEVETLRLCRELSEAPSTEAALVERAGRLGSFTDPSFAKVRRVERVRGALGGLSVVSAAVAGTRLSDVLSLAQRNWIGPDFDAVLYVLEQVAGGVAALHKHSRDLSHGTLGPERIVIRADGHPVIVEHVLAPAISQLQLGRAVLWTQFRVPAPAVAGTARLDQITDITQLGVLALALMLGRTIRREEFPQKLQELLTEASTPGALGPRPAVARSLHGWILRTLQFESRAAFRTAADAAAALDALVADQPRHKISPAAVIAYVAACNGPAGAARAVASPPAPPDDAHPAPAEPVSASARCEPDPTVTTRLFRSPASDTTGRVRSRPEARPPQIRGRGRSQPPAGGEKKGGSILARLFSTMVRGSVGQVTRLDWPTVRRGVRVALVSLGLVALFGVTYLGARGYLGFSSFIGGRGTLVVESSPTGAELYVDGHPSGRTPATLELRAGEHTLSLRSGRRTTLVPGVVVSGARRVERVEMRQRRPAPRVVPAPPAGTPSVRSPQVVPGSASATAGK